MIRLATEADVPVILEIYRPYIENTSYSFEYDVPTLEAFTQRFRGITAQFPWLVWEENGTVLGYAYGSYPFERAGYAWCAEVSIYLAPQIQGCGIGKALYQTLEKLLAIQGFTLIYSIITTENTGSIAFHRALGYELFAEFTDCAYKFGRKLSVAWMQKRLDSVTIPNAFPKMWLSIVENSRNLQDILDSFALS